MMKEYRKTLASLVFAGIASVAVMMTPVMEAEVAAFSCCTPQGSTDEGCNDTYAQVCRADGECHSRDKKSCSVGWFSCGWINDSNCSGEIEGD